MITTVTHPPFPTHSMSDAAGAIFSEPLVQRLSPREREVLDLLHQGKRDREIARTLGISIRTAEHHVGSILRKLGTNTRSAAVRIAFGQRAPAPARDANETGGGVPAGSDAPAENSAAQLQ